MNDNISTTGDIKQLNNLNKNNMNKELKEQLELQKQHSDQQLKLQCLDILVRGGINNGSAEGLIKDAKELYNYITKK